MFESKNSFSVEVVVLLISFGHVLSFISIQCFAFLSKNKCIAGGI